MEKQDLKPQKEWVKRYLSQTHTNDTKWSVFLRTIKNLF